MQLRLQFFIVILTSLISYQATAFEQNQGVNELLDQAHEIEKLLYPNWIGGKYCPVMAGPAVHTQVRSMLSELKRKASLVDTKSLSPKDKVNFMVLSSYVKDKADHYKTNQHLLIIDHQTSFYSDMSFMLANKSLVDVAAYEKYIGCVRKLDQYANSTIEMLKLSLKADLLKPKLVLDHTAEQFREALKLTAEQVNVYRPFLKMPNSISKPEQDRLRKMAIKAINEVFIPEFHRVTNFFFNEYYPKAKDEIAASANGAEFYNYLVRHHTSLEDATPQSIHDLGVSEVRRIRSEMEAVKASTGFTGQLQEFFEFLRTDPQFYAKTEDEYVKEITYIMKKIDGRITELFNKIPRSPYGFQIMSKDISKSAPTAYASMELPKDPKGVGTGYFVINTYDLKSRPLFELVALTLHEADPGHHFQIALAKEQDDIHEFRRNQFFTAFTEGWGLYAESLGLDLGLYDNPYDNFGRLSYEMWRAMRLVVDTGMHSLGWTRQQAIDFMSDNSALSEKNIISEVDRYIAWPGQALGYKVGELQMQQLRRDVKQSQGANFNIREFHDVLLENGAVPMDVLIQIMNDRFGLENAKTIIRQD